MKEMNLHTATIGVIAMSAAKKQSKVFFHNPALSSFRASLRGPFPFPKQTQAVIAQPWLLVLIPD